MMIGAPGWILGNPSQENFDGLGLTRARWTAPPSGLGGIHLGITRARWMDPPHFSQQNVGQLEGITDIFESPIWKYRKPLILGGLGLAVVGVLTLAGFVLK